MKKVFGLLLVTAAITSCSSSDEHTSGPGSGNNEIRLTSKVNFTRSAYDTQLQAGSKVGFYVTEWADASTPGNPATLPFYENVELTADGNGYFDYATTMFYPQSGNKVDFHAYHPKSASVPTDVTAIPFGIQPDQTKLDNYLLSDLLWAVNEGVDRTNNIVPIEFKHKLSKLEFTIKAGDGVTLDNLDKVEVLQVAPGTTLNLATGAITAATGDPVDVSALGIAGTAGNELKGGEAIIVPQAKAGATKLLQITLGNVSFAYTPSDATTFEGGKKYSYVITVNMGGIVVKSSITDWDSSGDPTEGEGEMD